MAVSEGGGIAPNWTPIWQGTVLSLPLMPLAVANQFYEGDEGMVLLTVKQSVALDTLLRFEQQIRGAGVELWGSVTQIGNVVTVPFKVAAWPFWIIAGAVVTVLFAVAVVGVAVVKKKEIKPATSDVAQAVAEVAGSALGTAIKAAVGTGAVAAETSGLGIPPGVLAGAAASFLYIVLRR